MSLQFVNCEIFDQIIYSIVFSSANFLVSVFPLLSHSTVSVSACFSSMVHLSCDFIDADPTPSVSWFKDGHFIGNNSNPHSSATSDLLESSTLLLPNGALQIRNSRPSDSGSFHCTGKNFAGVRQGNQYRVNVSGK